MPKYFNITGPCHPDKHYMLAASDRCQGILPLIDQEQYFVIHAARQSGKTTLLMELERQLRAAGRYHVIYCSLEVAQKIDEPERGIPAIVRSLQTEIELNPTLQMYRFADHADFSDFTTILMKGFSQFCQQLDRPLVILFDEVDCLTNGTLIAFLRQLRAGYVNRNRFAFVHSVALVGMRNIRDYKGKIRDERETLGSASPFNIVAESFTLRNFTRPEIAALYAQHAAETGQEFPAEVTDRVFRLTNGQPWLVNAIARKLIMDDAMSAQDVEEIAQQIILNRPTHIDSLMERLREARVRKIVEPVILGEIRGYSSLDDDYQYVQDLGLLRVEQSRLMPSNPIYGEVMMRTLSSAAEREMDQQAFPPKAPAYVVEGRLDMQRLLTDFQQFWRVNSAIWQERFEYQEAAPHLVLQAFLQRVINAGGRLTREMASGRQRLDLCIHYQGGDYPIELKIRRDRQTITEGQRQLAEYMETLNCHEGWLLVFDQRTTISWKKKIFWRTGTIDGKTLHVVGC